MWLEFGGEVVMTDDDLQSGTDRVCQAAAKLAGDEGLGAWQQIVNVQGDMPFVSGEVIDGAISFFRKSQRFDLATIAAPINSLDLFNADHCVKVVISQSGQGLYFSACSNSV